MAFFHKMNIPRLELSKYVTKSTDKITGKHATISYLSTPPTSPDRNDPGPVPRSTVTASASTTTISVAHLNQQQQKRKLNDESNISNNFNEKRKKVHERQQTLDLHLLDRYLCSGKSTNVKDSTYGLNLLCWACQCRSIYAVKKIVEKGDIDINQRHGPHQLTALQIAAAVDFSSGIDFLTQHPNLDLNLKDTSGLTAVHYATRHNKCASLVALLEAGARSDVFDKHGRLPLHYAIRNSNAEIVEAILSNPGKSNPTFTNFIWSSANDKCCAIEEAVIFSGAISNKILKQLIDTGAFSPIDAGGWWEPEYQYKRLNLINLSIHWNRFECLRCLVVNTDIPLQRHALDLAVQQRKLDLVTYLRDVGGINPCIINGSNPSLLYAVNHGFMEMIPRLLTPDTSADCIQQAILFSKIIGKGDIFCDILKKQGKQPLQDYIE